MKNMFILLVVSLILTIPTRAQQKVTRYCVVSVRPKSAFTTIKMTVELHPWKHSELFSFRDTAVLSQLWKVTTLETVPDVLNYMSDIGWTFTGTSTYANLYLYGLYYFKREFDAGELAPPANP